MLIIRQSPDQQSSKEGIPGEGPGEEEGAEIEQKEHHFKVFERSKLSRLDGLRSAQSSEVFLRKQHRPMSDLWYL